jgi:hypothetical protein
MQSTRAIATANQLQASSKIKCEAMKFKINSMIAKAIMIHHSFLGGLFVVSSTLLL